MVVLGGMVVCYERCTPVAEEEEVRAAARETFLSSAYGYINVQWFRGGFVFEAHRLLYHSLERKVSRGAGLDVDLPYLQGYLAHKKLPPPLGPP